MSFNKKSLENLSAESLCLWCGVVPVELMRKALAHLDDQVSNTRDSVSSGYPNNDAYWIFCGVKYELRGVGCSIS